LNLILIAVAVAALSGGIALALRSQDNPGVRILLPTPTPTPQLRVYISGAVASPGVYALDPGSRVEDAVKAAGGFLNDANSDSVNLARRVRDEEQVHVPRDGEPISVLASATAQSDKVNINSASSEELQKLPRIGAVLADRIIEFRKKNGPFRSTDELLLVEGIGPSTYQNLKDLITVGPSDP